MQSLEGANIDAVSQAVTAVRCSARLGKDASEADFCKRQRKGRK